MFIRANILTRKFSKCTLSVKRILFKSYCLCFYDIALWNKYKKGTFDKFCSCYNRCTKMFFGFKRRDSLTQMLLNIQIPSFSTIVYNAKVNFDLCRLRCNNPLVKCFLF